MALLIQAFEYFLSEGYIDVDVNPHINQFCETDLFFVFIVDERQDVGHTDAPNKNRQYFPWTAGLAV